MIVIHCQSDARGTPEQGHYYACDCGLCSPVYHGEDSRLRAATWGDRHRKAKREAQQALIEFKNRNTTPRYWDPDAPRVGDLREAAAYSRRTQPAPASREWPAFIGFPAAVIALADMVVFELADRLTKLLHWDSR